jgi:hypothetical protein
MSTRSPVVSSINFTCGSTVIETVVGRKVAQADQKFAVLVTAFCAPVLGGSEWMK